MKSSTEAAGGKNNKRRHAHARRLLLFKAAKALLFCISVLRLAQGLDDQESAEACGKKPAEGHG
jgi:hypothetical protein